jgi:hypothetical protein
MRKTQLFFIVLLIPFFAGAQNTWIHRLGMGSQSYIHDDSLTGIREIHLCKDGTLLVSVQLDQDERQQILKLPAGGSPIQWSIDVGSHIAMSGSYIRTIYPTSDSGFIAGGNDWDWGPHSIGLIRKYNVNGIMEWEQQLAANFQLGYDKRVYDVCQNLGGNYYALVGDEINDTLYELDNSGNIIYETYVKGFRFFEMSNSNLLVQTFDSLLERRDTSGTLYWSVPSEHVLAFSDSFTIIVAPTGIQKVNNSNGVVDWTKNYPFSINSACITADGGFLAASGSIPIAATDYPSAMWAFQQPGTLCKIDLIGDTEWTQHFSFPHYGLSAILQLPNMDIITGGAYIFTDYSYLNFTRNYSAFIASLDSLGNGQLLTSSYLWQGNSNNNSICGFVDDVLYTGIALGFSGPPRDTSFQMYTIFDSGLMSDFCADWADTFANGVNYKHADFNGDGIIDTSDLNLYAAGFFGVVQPITIPNWRLANPDNLNSSIPDFQIIPEHDTVPPGASIKFYIIAGSNTVPVDSIYGLAFSSFINTGLISDSPQVTFTNSQLGLPGNDLVSMNFFPNASVLYAMECRTNHQNAIGINDTIGFITMTASPAISTAEVFHLQINDFRALTYDQLDVLFNIGSGDVVIDPSAVMVSENQNASPSIFPVPASENIFVGNLSHEVVSMEIISMTGKRIKQLKACQGKQIISITDLPDGIYTLRIISTEEVSNTRFMVRH